MTGLAAFADGLGASGVASGASASRGRGSRMRAGIPTADAMLLLTSRVSVEMVQKASVLGAPVVVAVSAPTRLAVTTAEAAGLTLVAVARADGFEVFTAASRVAWPTG